MRELDGIELPITKFNMLAMMLFMSRHAEGHAEIIVLTS